MSCDLVRRFKHFHEERVYGRISDQLEEEEVLQTLEADGAQCRQTQQQLGKSNQEKVDKREEGGLITLVWGVILKP